MGKNDRRSYFRVKEVLPVSLILRDPKTRKPNTFEGEAIDVGLAGLSISTQQVLFPNDKGIINIELPQSLRPVRARIKVHWRNDEKHHYGIEFIDSPDNLLIDWAKFIKNSNSSIPDRRGRETSRRSRSNRDVALADSEKRKIFRRISDLLHVEESANGKASSIYRTDMVPNQKEDYTLSAAKTRREWLALKTGVDLKHVGSFSEEPRNVRGNIENFIGMAQVPIGIAGPLKINGEYAKGIYYVPMATTEGVLVVSYTLGMTLVTQAGGVNTRILKDEMHISPVFGFDTARTALRFVEWVKGNFEIIKREAEKTTKYGKLIKIEPHLLNRQVILKFCYETGDAMGMNMINIATEKACELIVSTIKPEKFYLRSNFSSDKKVTAHNFVNGKGKTVVADVIIQRKNIERFNTAPEEIEAYFKTVLFTSSHAGMMGMNGQIANTIAALFIAFGQDVANVANSFMGITSFEVDRAGDLYISIYLPSLILGTIGGGTDLGSQKECLKIVACNGPNRSRKLAEIIAATALAGELAICLSIVNGTFVKSHLNFGRKGLAN